MLICHRIVTELNCPHITMLSMRLPVIQLPKCYLLGKCVNLVNFYLFICQMRLKSISRMSRHGLKTHTKFAERYGNRNDEDQQLDISLTQAKYGYGILFDLKDFLWNYYWNWTIRISKKKKKFEWCRHVNEKISFETVGSPLLWF